LATRKNILTSSARTCSSRSETNVAKSVQCPRRQLGGRPVGPILRDHLLLVVEHGAIGDDLACLLDERRRAGRGRTLHAERVVALEREGLHVLPVRRDEGLDDEAAFSVRDPERLPATDFGDEIRRIDRRVAGVVRVGPRIEVAELVRAVLMSKGEHRGAGGVADARRRRGIDARIRRVVAEIVHQPVEHRLLAGGRDRRGHDRRRS
jgi:hypothetical protein